MSRRTRRTGGLQSTVERPATPAMRSVGGCASALRRCSAGPRRSPVSARPVIAVWPVSAGYSRRRPLPTISSGCANWWGPRRSHARNPPTHRKGQQNRCKDLLDEQRSATQARVTFDDPKFCFANSEFFSVLLGLLLSAPPNTEARHQCARQCRVLARSTLPPNCRPAREPVLRFRPELSALETLQSHVAGRSRGAETQGGRSLLAAPASARSVPR